MVNCPVGKELRKIYELTFNSEVSSIGTLSGTWVRQGIGKGTGMGNEMETVEVGTVERVYADVVVIGEGRDVGRVVTKG